MDKLFKTEYKVLCIYNNDRHIGCTNHNEDFLCHKVFGFTELFIGCNKPKTVSWTTYLINKKHLIEVK